MCLALSPVLRRLAGLICSRQVSPTEGIVPPVLVYLGVVVLLVHPPLAESTLVERRLLLPLLLLVLPSTPSEC